MTLQPSLPDQTCDVGLDAHIETIGVAMAVIDLQRRLASSRHHVASPALDAMFAAAHGVLRDGGWHDKDDCQD